MTDFKRNARSPFEIVDLDDRTTVEKFIEGSFGEKMTHDKFFARILVDRLSARLFLETTLKRRVLRELDLDTLQVKRTRMLDVDGRECVGDLFYTVELKRKRGRRGRRAVFALILEHKADDYVYVSIQLLGYVWAWLDYMKERPEEFADANGKLPTPYALVFSQDWNATKKVPFLHRILYWLPKMRRTVPTFWFQHIRASELPIERIKRSEPLMRAFFQLEALARKRKSSGSELDEIADCFGNLWKIKNPDERISAGVQACMNYLSEIKATQPFAPTVRQVYERVRERQGVKMDVLSQFTEWFPDVIAPVLAQRDEAEARYQESEAGRLEERAGRLEERAGRLASEAERVAERQSFRQRIFKKFQMEYQREISDSLREKLERIDSLYALTNLYEALWKAENLERFERLVDEEIENSRTDVLK